MMKKIFLFFSFLLITFTTLSMKNEPSAPPDDVEEQIVPQGEVVVYRGMVYSRLYSPEDLIRMRAETEELNRQLEENNVRESSQNTYWRKFIPPNLIAIGIFAAFALWRQAINNCVQSALDTDEDGIIMVNERLGVDEAGDILKLCW